MKAERILDKNRKKKVLCVSMILLLLFSGARARGQGQYHDDAFYTYKASAAAAGNSITRRDAAVQSGDTHQSKLGILASAAVPGSGEILNGKWKRGLLLLGLEAGLWYGYTLWHGRGDEIKGEFHDYANTHWSEEQWKEYYNDDLDPSTHSLPDTKTQQYYEMIGKYDQFKQGWSDWSPDGPDLTPRRNEYETMRDESNQNYIRASYCTMAVLANHLLSALDTALILRQKRQAGARVRMGLLDVEGRIKPVMSLSLQW